MQMAQQVDTAASMHHSSHCLCEKGRGSSAANPAKWLEETLVCVLVIGLITRKVKVKILANFAKVTKGR